MKSIFNFYLLIFLFIVNINSVKAQCSVGKSKVNIEVKTDQFGYEGYWELIPFGNSCGSGTILFGGNKVQVGCNGGGAPTTATNGNGYAANTIYISDSVCLTNGTSYTLKYIDDYTDGGFEFKIRIEDLPIYTYSGKSPINTYNFLVKPAPNYDLSVNKIAFPLYIHPSTNDIKGSIFNFGKNSINSFDLNYKINSGSVVTKNITGVNILSYSSFDFVHPTAWSCAANGSYTIDVWASNFNNGNNDTNLLNDHKTFVVVTGDTIPNKIDDYTKATHSMTIIANSSNGILQPRDLDFHPILTRNEMWVVLQSTEMIGGKTAKISKVGDPSQNVLVQKDGNAYHFMSMPTGIAFSNNGNFCTSPGVLDANHTTNSATDHFTGPALWSSDPLIYAMPSGGNGSHLDMLHQCPYAMGVAWEKENVFWIYDAYNYDLMRCDFSSDHGPGNSDHSNGMIRSYEDFSLSNINLDIPCHLALDASNKWLYIVDGYNRKVIRMDINTGSKTGNFVPYAEPLAENSIYTGTTYSDYVTKELMQPSGIDVIGNRLVVSDYQTGNIYLYDCSGPSGVLLGTIKTGAPGVQGVKIGPDGKIYYVNYLSNEVVRIDYKLKPVDVSDISDNSESIRIDIIPNPITNSFIIEYSGNKDIYNTIITDQAGKNVKSALYEKDKFIDVSDFETGIYYVKLFNLDNNLLATKKIIKL